MLQYLAGFFLVLHTKKKRVEKYRVGSKMGGGTETAKPPKWQDYVMRMSE